MKIPGVCAIVTDNDGTVLASRVDFDRTGYGGFTLEEAQRYRAQRFVRGVFFQNMTSPRFVKYDDYFLDQFWKMAEANGFKITTVPVVCPSPPEEI